MLLENYLKTISGKRNGTFITVETRTPVTGVNAASRKAGYSIYKRMTAQYRTGVRYSNLAVVIAAKAEADPNQEPKTNPKKNFAWVVDNIVGYNCQKNEYYARLVPRRHRKTKAVYELMLNDTLVSTSDNLKSCEAYLQPSYLNSTPSATPVKDIKVSNIISIH